MRQFPSIGILLPVYNNVKYIKECLESLIRQDYPHFKIYITDDGSNDGSSDILEEYSHKHENIDLYSFTGNRGVGYAMNNAGKRALKDGNDFVFVMSGDDRMIQGGLRTAYKVFKERVKENVQFVTCAIKYIGGASGVGMPGSVATYESNLAGNVICGFSLIPADVWRKSRGYDAKLFNPPFKCSMEDYEFYTRLLKEGTYLVCKEPVVEYRIHPKQTITKAASYRPVCIELMAKKHPEMVNIHPHFKK